jgi:hypothetical protein
LGLVAWVYLLHRILPSQSLAITLADGSTLSLDGAALKEALQYR